MNNIDTNSREKIAKKIESFFYRWALEYFESLLDRGMLGPEGYSSGDIHEKALVLREDFIEGFYEIDLDTLGNNIGDWDFHRTYKESPEEIRTSSDKLGK